MTTLLIPRSLRCSTFVRTLYASYPATTTYQDKKLPTLNSVRPKSINFFERAKKNINYYTSFKYTLRHSGLKLYSQHAEEPKLEEFVAKVRLPDTFYSWFMVTELHMWMLCARIMADEEHGQFLGKAICDIMWEDIEARSKQMGMAGKQRRTGMKTFQSQFSAGCLAYDECVRGDDKMLAGALLNVLFDKKCDPLSLAATVEYVRRNMEMLEAIPMERFYYTDTPKTLVWKTLRRPQRIV